MISTENIFDALNVQIYWSTFILIGLAISLFLTSKFRIKLNEKNIRKYSIGLVAPIFFIGVFAFVPIIIISYLLNLSLSLITFQYFLLLGMSTYYLVREKRRVIPLVQILVSEVRNSLGLKLSLITLLTISLTAFLIGSSAGGDTFVHVAKINLIADNGFSLADPFFRSIDESRYNFNILYALYALLTVVLKYYAYDAWIFSAGFFTFVGLSALYLLTKTFISHKRYSYLPDFTFVASVILGLNLSLIIAATYPSYAALTSIAIFIVCLYKIDIKIYRYLLFVTAIMVAMLHITYAMGALGLVALYVFVLLLFGEAKVIKENYRLYIMISVVLAIPILVALSYPNNMAQSTIDYGSTTELDLPIGKILNPRGFTLYRITIGFLSLLGALHLIMNEKVRSRIILIVCLTLFFALIAYNPIIFSIIADYIPRWAIARLQQINRLSVITSGLGLLIVLFWITRKFRILPPKATFAVIILALVAINSPRLNQEYMNHNKYYRDTSVIAEGLKNQSSILKDKTILATSNTSYLLPSFSTLKVTAINPNHASPVANIEKRIQCQDKYLNLLGDEEISNLGIDLVVIGTWDAHYLKVAANSQYLDKISQSGPIIVFEVRPSEDTKLDKQCIFLEG